MSITSLLSPRLVKWVGYPLFAVLCFFVFLYLSFPYDKLKDRLEQILSASGSTIVTIEELGPRPLLGLSADRVLFLVKPKQSTAPPAPLVAGPQPGAEQPPAEETPKPKTMRILLERVVVKTGLFALLTGGTSVQFAVQGLGGEIEGEYSGRKGKGWSLQVEASKLDLGSVPAVGEAVGLPVKGQLSFKVDLTVPADKWSEASGSFSLECEECAVGDGKAKLKVPGNPLLAMGLTLPRIQLGRLGGQVKIEKGVATFENVGAKSPDIEVGLEGSVALRSPVGYSNSQGYLRFRVTPELKKRDPKFELLENGLSSARRSDGFFGMRIVGPLKDLRFIPSNVGPAQRGGPEPGGPEPLHRFPAHGRAPSAVGGARGG